MNLMKINSFSLEMNYSLFTSRLTHCPHPKSTADQKGRGTWGAAQIISEQAVTNKLTID
jgi:hypothetical protein